MRKVWNNQGLICSIEYLNTYKTIRQMFLLHFVYQSLPCFGFLGQCLSRKQLGLHYSISLVQWKGTFRLLGTLSSLHTHTLHFTITFLQSTLQSSRQNLQLYGSNSSAHSVPWPGPDSSLITSLQKLIFDSWVNRLLSLSLSEIRFSCSLCHVNSHTAFYLFFLFGVLTIPQTFLSERAERASECVFFKWVHTVSQTEFILDLRVKY